LSIIWLLAASFRKSTAGKLPSASRGPSAPELSMLSPVPDTLGSETLRKSFAVGVRLRSHELKAVSTPVMLLFLLG
jgi:hypothetical protein